MEFFWNKLRQDYRTRVLYLLRTRYADPDGRPTHVDLSDIAECYLDGLTEDAAARRILAELE